MKPVLEVLSGKTVNPPPCWFMRQAGRYLPEYRDVREKAGGFLNLCFNPDLAAEVTLQPVKRYGTDAAILFSDILIVPYLLGQQLEFLEGEGPKLGPLEVNKLKADLTKAEPIFETVRKVKAAQPENCTLIGFAGSPWTIASYMIEGGSSQDFQKIRGMARANPAALEKVMDKIIDCTISYVEGQINAGAEVIQLFDSWAGKCDNPQRWVIEPTAAIVLILKSMHPKIPIIGFPRGLPHNSLSSYGVLTQVDAVGLDQTVDMNWAAAHMPKKVALQGNLDPEILLSGGDAMKEQATHILDAMKARPFIFNLGHGINKDTPPEHLAQLISHIRGT